jgi:hypothetical protein
MRRYQFIHPGKHGAGAEGKLQIEFPSAQNNPAAFALSLPANSSSWKTIQAVLS